MNLVQRLLEEIGKKRKRIVVVGDAIVDLWVRGHCESCQDGCSKFVEEYRVVTPGGAENAQMCLSHWGVNTRLVTYSKECYPTKCRFVDRSGSVVMRWDDDARMAEERATYGWAREVVLDAVHSADAVLLSDYDKSFLSPQLIRDVVGLCSQQGTPCVADAKREPEVYRGAVLKCNDAYYERYFEGIRGTSTSWVVTRGHHPPYVQHIKGGTGWATTQSARCVNHVGAGDCFAAHLALALACGFTLEEAATLAHSAGRVYVQYPHNRPPRPEEVAADLGDIPQTAIWA